MAYFIHKPMFPAAPLVNWKRSISLIPTMKTESLVGGVPLPADVLDKLRLTATVNPDVDVIPNFIVTSRQWVVCQEFKETIERLNMDDAQFVPIDITYADGTPCEKKMFFLYVLATFSAKNIVDLEHSEVRAEEDSFRAKDPNDPPIISVSYHPLGGAMQSSIVLKKSAIGDHAVFRITACWPDSLYVSDAAIEAWKETGVPGLEYYPIRES